jgi:hypothetical protein
MRKVALLAAVVLAAAFTVTSADAASKAKPDPAIAAQKNSANLMRDAFNPFQVASAKKAAKPAAKHSKKKMKKAKKKAKK